MTVIIEKDLFVRPTRHSLGAEELLELGKAEIVPAHRYAHTPFLANRPAMGRAQNPSPGVNLFMGAEPAAAPAPSPRAPGVVKALTIGIPVAGAAAMLFMVAR